MIRTVRVWNVLAGVQVWPRWMQELGKFVLVVGAAVAAIFLWSLIGGDESSSDTQSDADLRSCPDYLEVAGPYRVGIDPEYVAAMDWDGDGVSCE